MIMLTFMLLFGDWLPSQYGFCLFFITTLVIFVLVRIAAQSRSWFIPCFACLCPQNCAPLCLRSRFSQRYFCMALCTHVVVADLQVRRLNQRPSFDRQTAGFAEQVALCTYRGVLQQTRAPLAVAFDMVMCLFSSVFQGWMNYTKPFQGPVPLREALQCPTAPFDLRPLCAVPIHDAIDTESAVICLAVALAAVSSSLRVFGNEITVFWRESASGTRCADMFW
jgi:hypothetical protein